MKRLLSCAIAFLGLLGCYGKSAPERSPDWEADLPATARAPSLPMLVLGAAQAYATGSAADFSLFNLAESWGGSDPATLKRRMKEIQPVEWNGASYFLIAGPNRLDITKSMEGGLPLASLRYDPATLAWYAEIGSEKAKVAEWTDERRRVLMLIRPDGTRLAVKPQD